MNELYHHGVKGMKWGVWNEETRARYSGDDRSISNKQDDKKSNSRKGLSDRQKKALKNGAIIAGSLVLAYGAYKVGTNIEANLKAKDLLTTHRNAWGMSKAAARANIDFKDERVVNKWMGKKTDPHRWDELYKANLEKELEVFKNDPIEDRRVKTVAAQIKKDLSDERKHKIKKIFGIDDSSYTGPSSIRSDYLEGTSMAIKDFAESLIEANNVKVYLLKNGQ